MKGRSKYRNVRTVVDGITFHSRQESQRYLVLKEELARGDIADLRLQVPYQLSVNGMKICKYIADFVYFRNGEKVVEDVKGRLTDVYKLKRKLMRACHGIEIYET